jgi:hypothetical protein
MRMRNGNVNNLISGNAIFSLEHWRLIRATSEFSA